MNDDTLQKTLLQYMQQHELQWGIYLAMIHVKSSQFCFRVAFEFDVDEKAHEYVFIFQGKRKCVYVGEYDIIYVEIMEEY